MQHKKRRLVAVAAALGLVAGGGAAYASNSHSASQRSGRGVIVGAVTG